MPTIRPVVLSGGSGTRLWPLSTPSVPKQFVPLIGDRTLFGLTLSRLDAEPPIVVTGRAHLDLVTQSAKDEKVELGLVVAEPYSRNTAPAAIAAALLSNDDDVLAILPSDHWITDRVGFALAVETAAEHARDGIVTFGIEPTRVETGYGYILASGDSKHVKRVDSFVEKPSADEAAEMVAGGGHMWNSGIYVAAAGLLLEETRVVRPGLVESVEAVLGEPGRSVVYLDEGFEDVESVSIDHAIMEKTRRGLVMSLEVGWDDLGTYRSLLGASEVDAEGNHVDGDVVLQDVSGSYVRAATRRVVVAGLTDVVVVDAPEGVLVIPIDRSQEVRDLS